MSRDVAHATMNTGTVEWEEVGCDLCKSKLQGNCIDVSTKYSDVNPAMKLVRCLGCNLVYLNPRPTQETIGEFYSADYYAHTGLERRKKTLRAQLRNRFLEGLGGYGNSLDLQIIRRVAPRWLVDIIVPSERQGRLLDVGCGDGERANWYRERGFEVYGVELSETGAANANKIGIQVHQGTLSGAGYPDGFFDIVVMAHVLEHTHSPNKYLEEAFRILKPGGMLVVAVPNIESHSANIFGADWAFLMLPIHLYHFSTGTLSACLRRNGFSIDSLVGKIVYPRMVRRSRRSMRRRRPFRSVFKAWWQSGILPSSFACLRSGVSRCDTITAYCTKPLTPS